MTVKVTNTVKVILKIAMLLIMMMTFTSDLVSVEMFAWQFGHTVVTESGPKRILIENIFNNLIENMVFAAFCHLTLWL